MSSRRQQSSERGSSLYSMRCFPCPSQFHLLTTNYVGYHYHAGDNSSKFDMQHYIHATQHTWASATIMCQWIPIGQLVLSVKPSPLTYHTSFFIQHAAIEILPPVWHDRNLDWEIFFYRFLQLVVRHSSISFDITVSSGQVCRSFLEECPASQPQSEQNFI